MATVDPKEYYDTAKYLTDLGTRLGKANTDLISGLSGCGGMAGNYDDAKKWSQSYDQTADSVIDNTRKLAETLGHFGSLLSWAGYNHELANYNSNIASNKGAAPTAPPPVPADLCYVDSPTAFGGSGNGLDTDIPNLLEDIGIPVPDGDTGKLDSAASAWHAFITSAAVEDAMNLSLLGAIRFQHTDSPEVPDIQDHLSTLGGCAISIQDTANRLRQACSDHSDGLTQLRSTLHDLLRDLDIQLGLTIAITIFTSFLSAGTSVAAGGSAAGVEVAATAARMATAIRDLKILERIAQAFKDAKDLTLLKTKNLLSAILDLRRTSATESIGGLYSRAGALTNSQVIEQNVGLPRTMDTVERYARLAGIDLSQANIEILGDSDNTVSYLDYQGAIARTDGQGVQLGPAAFQDEETLVRTLAHENVHVQQYLDGRVSSVTQGLEDEAYGAEDPFVDTWRRNTGK